MQEEDRIKFYNWNLFCIGLTVVPIAWIYTKNYDTCFETSRIWVLLWSSISEGLMLRDTELWLEKAQDCLICLRFTFDF